MVGECGLDEREAALVTFRRLACLYKARELRVQQRWEMARWAVWQLSLPHYKKGQAPHTPQEFMPLPWEEAKRQQELEQSLAEWQPATASEMGILDDIFYKDNNG